MFGVFADYPPLWSLAVEEHFYIFWPAVVYKLTRKRLTIVILAICAMEPVLRAISFRLGYVDGLGMYTWLVADGLATGGLLAILLRTSASRKMIAVISATLLGGGFLLAGVGRPFGVLTRERMLGAVFQETLIDAVFAGLLLLVLLLGTGPARRYVNSSVLRFLGYISYGLYLIHQLVFWNYDKLCRRFWPSLQPTSDHFGLVVLRFAVGAGVAIAVSYFSRTYFEERFLRLKDRFGGAKHAEILVVPGANAEQTVPEEASA